MFVPPIFLTLAQELTENDDFAGRSMKVRMSKNIHFVISSFYRLRRASHNSRRVEIEFFSFRRYLYHQFFWQSPKNSPRTMTLMGGRMVSGDEKKFVLWSDCSTVSARCHTNPEGPKLNSPCSGDILYHQFFWDSPRIHQVGICRGVENWWGVGVGEVAGFFLEPCSN
jgi:hypothetical protein